MRARGPARTRVSAAKVCLRLLAIDSPAFSGTRPIAAKCVPCTNAFFPLGNVHETYLQAPHPPSAVLANTTLPCRL